MRRLSDLDVFMDCYYANSIRKYRNMEFYFYIDDELIHGDIEYAEKIRKLPLWYMEDIPKDVFVRIKEVENLSNKIEDK